MLSIDDVDETLIPTAELTIVESAELRDVLRRLAEVTARKTLGGWR